jgi:hypothetical protein
VNLWKTVDELTDESDHPTWAGGKQDGTSVLHMPYVTYGDAVNQVVGGLHDLDLIVPFNWPEWDGRARSPAGRGLADAPVADAVRMITEIVRADRFSEGSIAATLEDGTLPAALNRLRRWYDEAGGTEP